MATAFASPLGLSLFHIICPRQLSLVKISVSNAHRAGGFRVQHLFAGAVAALPCPLPAGRAGAAHRFHGRDAAIAEHQSGRPCLHAGPAPFAACAGAGGRCTGAGVLHCIAAASAGAGKRTPTGHSAPAGVSAHRAGHELRGSGQSRGA